MIKIISLSYLYETNLTDSYRDDPDYMGFRKYTRDKAGLVPIPSIGRGNKFRYEVINEDLFMMAALKEFKL